MIRRVLMTADTVGGVWTYSLDLAKGLVSRGIDVAIATMGRRMSPSQAQQARDFVVFESDYALEWMENPWSDVDAAGDWLLELEQRFSPDVVHLNGYCHGGLPWTAPTLMVCHSCVASWYEAVRGLRAPAEWDRYQNEVRHGLQSADLVVAPTQAMLDAATRHYGPLADARVFPNGRDLNKFHPQTKEPFVFTSGRLWDEAKNVAALDAISSTLEWPVYVAGDDVERGGLSRLGTLTELEMSDWFGHASIYALPARYEPFGLSVLEAALSSCALVLGNIPSLRENWNECAVFVDPDDHQQLRAAISDLMENEQRRIELGRKARTKAKEFGHEVFASRYVDAYHELVNAKEGACLI